MNVSPVFDLQQVADEAVAGAALHEVPLSGEEGLCGEAAVFLQEVVKQRQLTLLPHLEDTHTKTAFQSHRQRQLTFPESPVYLVQGDGVEDGLDHPAV